MYFLLFCCWVFALSIFGLAVVHVDDTHRHIACLSFSYLLIVTLYQFFSVWKLFAASVHLKLCHYFGWKSFEHIERIMLYEKLIMRYFFSLLRFAEAHELVLPYTWPAFPISHNRLSKTFQNIKYLFEYKISPPFIIIYAAIRSEHTKKNISAAYVYRT